MAWPKGKPRPEGAGRRKGTPNKRTLAEAACARANIDPFDLLVSHAVNGDIGAVIQLCKHIEPVRKPVDVEVDPVKNQIIVRVVDYSTKS